MTSGSPYDADAADATSPEKRRNRSGPMRIDDDDLVGTDRGHWYVGVAPRAPINHDVKDVYDRYAGPDPADVSGWWKYALLAAIGMPIALIVLGMMVAVAVSFGNVTGAIGVLVTLIAIVAVRLTIPYCIRKDIDALVASNVVSWRPRKTLYTLVTLFAPPPLEFVATVIYVYRRHLFVGDP